MDITVAPARRASEGPITNRRLNRRTLAGASGVRRERSVSSRGCETHIWKEVVNQEAVEADREATNGREPSMSKGCFRQFSESAGHNLSERRAGPENASCGSRPVARTGKASAVEAENNLWPRRFHRGKGDGTRQGEFIGNTGDPPRWSNWKANQKLARARLGRGGSRRGS